MQWDVFCRVIDNHGDLGVCWRLAADLGTRGERVRLWVDDAAALRWMAPGGADGVQLRAWPAGDVDAEPGDVVIEAFGCALPEPFVRRMATGARAPVWVNLEYLSAEDYVERSHRLASPQTTGPAAGLRKWFFYPGFSAATGGLLREHDLFDRQRAFDAPAWLHAQGLAPGAHERVVSLFCYEQPALPALIDRLAAQPTLLLATAGLAARQVGALLGPVMRRGALRAVELPALTQLDFDHLLWASDLNFVRGEDSFVRAQWAGKPFVWQTYAQHDGAHQRKLGAFLARFLAGAPPRLAAEAAEFWNAWNAGAARLPTLPPPAPWQRACLAWRDRIGAQTDLVSQLLGFARETR